MVNNSKNQQTLKTGEARATFATYGQWKQRLHINWTDNFYMSVESSPKRYLTQWNTIVRGRGTLVPASFPVQKLGRVFCSGRSTLAGLCLTGDQSNI